LYIPWLTDAGSTLVWLRSSGRDLRAFPALVRRLAGFQLRRVQQGVEPDDWKPMQTVGPAVREICIHIAGPQSRGWSHEGMPLV
jgi:phage-related protein